MKVSHLLNLDHSPTWFDIIYFPLWAGTSIVRYGFDTLKAAIISGQYAKPGFLFYGGQELQPSHKALLKFLRANLDLEAITHVGLIDVHTGVFLNYTDLQKSVSI